MTDTEATWSARVAEWKASGKTVEEFAASESYAPSTLRWWSSRLRRRVPRKSTSPSVAMVKVVRTSEARREPLVVEVGLARIVGGDGFDAALLARVVAALSETK
jgi:hypothetical protein